MNDYIVESGQIEGQQTLESGYESGLQNAWDVVTPSEAIAQRGGHFHSSQASGPSNGLSRESIRRDPILFKQILNQSFAAEFDIPRAILTRIEVEQCQCPVAQVDVAYIARCIGRTLYPDPQEQQQKVAIVGYPRLLVMSDRGIIEGTCAQIKDVLETAAGNGLVLLNLENVMMDALFTRAFAELFRPDKSRDKEGTAAKRREGGSLLFYPGEGALPQLHHDLSRVGGATLAVVRTSSEHREAVYIGKVEKFWETILARLHSLAKPTYSGTVAKTLHQTDKDISARLSTVHRSQLVLREWDKSAEKRGAYRYASLTSALPQGFVSGSPRFARSEELVSNY